MYLLGVEVVDDVDGGVLGVVGGAEGSADRLVVSQECDSRTADLELENLYAKVSNCCHLQDYTYLDLSGHVQKYLL